MFPSSKGRKSFVAQAGDINDPTGGVPKGVPMSKRSPCKPARQAVFKRIEGRKSQESQEGGDLSRENAQRSALEIGPRKSCYAVGRRASGSKDEGRRLIDEAAGLSVLQVNYRRLSVAVTTLRANIIFEV